MHSDNFIVMRVTCGFLPPQTTTTDFESYVALDQYLQSQT